MRTISRLLMLAAFAAVVAIPAGAEIITMDMPELQRVYGGATGDTFQDTTFDFGIDFVSVDDAWLHLVGFTDIGQSTLTFTPTLDDVQPPPTVVFLGEGGTEVPFHVDLRFIPPDTVLDGVGAVTLTLETIGPGVDLSTTVTEATLYFDSIPVPEPAAVALLLLGAIACGGRRG